MIWWVTTGSMTETLRHGSRLLMSLMWTSTTGPGTSASASCSTYEWWTRAPALMIRASKSRSSMRSMRTPSWFDCRATREWPRRGGMRGRRRLDLGQRGAAVDLGLALAEAAEVRAVEQQDPHDAPSSLMTRRAASSSRSVMSSTSMTRPMAMGRIQRCRPPTRFLSAPRARLTASGSKARRSR